MSFYYLQKVVTFCEFLEKCIDYENPCKNSNLCCYKNLVKINLCHCVTSTFTFGEREKVRKIEREKEREREIERKKDRKKERKKKRKREKERKGERKREGESKREREREREKEFKLETQVKK